jgi:hypothetical protein
MPHRLTGSRDIRATLGNSAVRRARADLLASLDDLHAVAALHGRQAVRPAIVAEAPGRAPVAPGKFELREVPWQPVVEDDQFRVERNRPVAGNVEVGLIYED